MHTSASISIIIITCTIIVIQLLGSNVMVYVLSDYSCCMYSKFGAYTGGYVPECTTPPPGNKKMEKERYSIAILLITLSIYLYYYIIYTRTSMQIYFTNIIYYIACNFLH